MDALGIDRQHYHHQHQHQHQHHDHGLFTTPQLPPQLPRKRKADVPPENNERLSKRLSLLNLEQSGQKLYVPVENSTPQIPGHSSSAQGPNSQSAATDEAPMQLDDSKYKVYIYNLEDELSSSDNESDADAGGKLVFLPDIEKHLRSNRLLPTPRVLDPRPDPAGMELVLYSVPSSISVPEEQDSVRKAILEARARARAKQTSERDQAASRAPVLPEPTAASSSPWGDAGSLPQVVLGSEGDPDAMDID